MNADVKKLIDQKNEEKRKSILDCNLIKKNGKVTDTTVRK
jgi:hypothetical protein